MRDRMSHRCPDCGERIYSRALRCPPHRKQHECEMNRAQRRSKRARLEQVPNCRIPSKHERRVMGETAPARLGVHAAIDWITHWQRGEN